ncbi:sensor histidine kinase [Vallitalea okinawensis]|uniref:sensor histidine kinase n=1 Tax=Vallitalea okinawensis TaxID=2078660 RepID=UPI00147860A6|nr:sensor histidine kinase [Vallitalea okinawensis]
MKKKFFIKNLITFIIPIIIPVIVLGTLSITLLTIYNSKSISNNTINSLEKTKQSADIIFQESDGILLNFTHSIKIATATKNILNTDSYSLYDIQSLGLIKNLLYSTTTAKQYIHSIYVYMSQPDKSNPRVLTTTVDLVVLNQMVDTDWYDTYRTELVDKSLYSESRPMMSYAFETEPVQVLTIYRKLNTTYAPNENGVVVLNLNQDYVDHLLTNQSAYKEQKVLILNGSREVISKSDNVTDEDIQYFENNEINDDAQEEVKINGEDYLLYHAKSANKNWTYVTLSPKSLAYKWSYPLYVIVILVILISFFIALILTYLITKRNYNHLLNIVDMLEYAGSKKKLPPIKDANNEYEFITQNIIKTFLEQQYLKSELATRKYKLKAMELLALQSQMNPHFLFNTLETIKWKTIQLTGSSNQASKMLEHLSDILSYTLEYTDDMTTLDEEIKYTKDYLSIMRIRYPDKFFVTWDYDETYKDLPIIKLLLQPLIENSIYHGIKEKEGISEIKIKIKVRQDCIVVHLYDNGLGMTEEKLAHIRHMMRNKHPLQSKHVGLINTCKRIQLAYNDQATIYIYSELGEGTLISMKLPVQKKI